MIHNGLSFPPSYTQLQSASSVHDRSVQWTLGAILYRTRFFPLRLVMDKFTYNSYTLSLFLSLSRCPSLPPSLPSCREIQQAQMKTFPSSHGESHSFTSILVVPFFLPSVVVVMVVALLVWLRHNHPPNTTKSGSFISRKRSLSLMSLVSAQSKLTSRAPSNAKLPMSSIKSDESEYLGSNVKFFV